LLEADAIGDAGGAACPAGAVTPAWVEWIADNLLQDCAVATLVATMQAAGIPHEAALQAVSAVRADPCFRAAGKQRQMLRKLGSMAAVLAGLQTRQRGDMPIERRSQVACDDFVRDYYMANRPLILTDLADDWPAMTRWTPAYFADRFGGELVEIQAGRNADADYEINSPRHKHQLPMRDFVDAVTSGRAGNDQYLTANNHALKRPGLRPLLDDIGRLPPWCDRSQLPGQALLWFGGPGVVTPMHHDTLQLLHTQVLGRKRWRLVSPLQTPLVYNHIGVFSKLSMTPSDRQRYPLADQLDIIDVVVEPGETLFVPVGWWHHVQTLDVCISLSYTNFSLPNQFEFTNPHIADW
jgi:ribosomal protein L16 Arg81 hydroxylase